LEGLASDAYIPPAGISGTGLLPIQIDIPVSGQLYRFARTIINPEDPLQFSVLYTRMWATLLIKWLIIFFIIWIIYLKRKRIVKFWRLIKNMLNPFIEKINKQDTNIKKFAESPALPLILILFTLLFSMISGPLSLYFFLLFLVSGGYYIYRRFEKKRKKVKAKKNLIKDTASRDTTQS
jgi:hypothetical protein